MNSLLNEKMWMCMLDESFEPCKYIYIYNLLWTHVVIQ